MEAPVKCPEPSKEDLANRIGFNWIEGRGWIKHKTNIETGVFEPVE
jgi:hypothetical protein